MIWFNLFILILLLVAVCVRIVYLRGYKVGHESSKSDLEWAMRINKNANKIIAEMDKGLSYQDAVETIDRMDKTHGGTNE